jgi:hypothetical protein
MGCIQSLIAEPKLIERAASDKDDRGPGQAHRDLWSEFRGHEIEPPLRSGAITLLEAGWLVRHADGGGRLLRRQELPPEAFMSLDDLLATGQSNDGLRVIAVSHAWLQPDHPDPFAYNLKILARVLDARTRSGVGGRWAVFIDFCCLHQSPPGGQRTPEEDALFREALGSLGALFAHQFTIVFLLSALPPDYPSGYALPSGAHVSGYWARGWTFTEASWAMLTKTYAKVLDLSKLSGDKRTYVGMRDECIAGGGRLPPLTPSAFEAQLTNRTFTNGKVDRPLVCQLYRTGFDAQFERAQSLVYGGLGWGDQEAEQLIAVLRIVPCASLRRLVLDDNQLGDRAARHLATLLREKRFERLEHLGLYGNAIGDAGMHVLQAALCQRRKCTPRLQEVALRKNAASPEAIEAFHKALQRRGAKADVKESDVTVFGRAFVVKES